MRKHGLLAGFVAGLLFVGVGSGVCFAEFSAFRYGGEKIPEAIWTDTAIKEVEAGDGKIVVASRVGNLTIEPTEGMAENQLEFLYSGAIKNQSWSISRNNSLTMVDGQGTRQAVDYYEVRSESNGLGVLSYMDSFIQGIKEKQFYEYRFDLAEKLVVRAAPQTAKRLISESELPMGMQLVGEHYTQPQQNITAPIQSSTATVTDESDVVGNLSGFSYQMEEDSPEGVISADFTNLTQLYLGTIHEDDAEGEMVRIEGYSNVDAPLTLLIKKGDQVSAVDCSLAMDSSLVRLNGIGEYRLYLVGENASGSIELTFTSAED